MAIQKNILLRLKRIAPLANDVPLANDGGKVVNNSLSEYVATTGRKPLGKWDK